MCIRDRCSPMWRPSSTPTICFTPCFRRLWTSRSKRSPASPPAPFRQPGADRRTGRNCGNVLTSPSKSAKIAEHPLLQRCAGVAQWQSTSLVMMGLWVRFPPPAPAPRKRPLAGSFYSIQRVLILVLFPELDRPSASILLWGKIEIRNS